MRAGIVVNVALGDRRPLEAIVGNRNAPQKHVWRAEIILATDEGCGTAEIMRRSGKARPVVWRWQARFMAEGVVGPTRDKARKPGKPPLPVATCGGWSIWRSSAFISSAQRRNGISVVVPKDRFAVARQGAENP
jgi:hypothetical protein